MLTIRGIVIQVFFLNQTYYEENHDETSHKKDLLPEGLSFAELIVLIWLLNAVLFELI
jgi:hypothetical protein